MEEDTVLIAMDPQSPPYKHLLMLVKQTTPAATTLLVLLYHKFVNNKMLNVWLKLLVEMLDKH